MAYKMNGFSGFKSSPLEYHTPEHKGAYETTYDKETDVTTRTKYRRSGQKKRTKTYKGSYPTSTSKASTVTKYHRKSGKVTSETEYKIKDGKRKRYTTRRTYDPTGEKQLRVHRSTPTRRKKTTKKVLKAAVTGIVPTTAATIAGAGIGGILGAGAFSMYQLFKGNKK